MAAMACDLGDLIRGKVFADGKEDFLDAVSHPRHGHGLCRSSLVGAGAYFASHGALLVGGLPQRVV